MRDRLSEMLEKAIRYADTHYPEGRPMEGTYTRLMADHLLAAGVIVPPCKVGDIVYAPHWKWSGYGKWDYIAPYQVTNITITQNKKGEWTKKYRAMEVRNGKTIDWQLNFSFDGLGKTVFLTKDEAERALAERREG